MMETKKSGFHTSFYIPSISSGTLYLMLLVRVTGTTGSSTKVVGLGQTGEDRRAGRGDGIKETEVRGRAGKVGTEG